MNPTAFCLVLFVSVLVAVEGYIPKYITPCKVRSADFSECAVRVGNTVIPVLANGDKKLGTPNFKPLNVPFIEFSSGDFKLNGTNVVVEGLHSVKLRDMKVNLDTRASVLNVTCPEINLELDYNLLGKIAGLNLEGHGKGKITANDADINYNFVYDEYKKDGKTYINIGKDHLDIFPKKLFIQLDNLFNGNKQLGETTNKFLNENWPIVLDEFRPVITEVVTSVIRAVVKPITQKVSLNELFQDY